MRVQIPCLPLVCLDGEKEIMPCFYQGVPGSNPGRDVLLWCLWCSGFCMAGCEPAGSGSTPLRHPFGCKCKKENRMVAKILERPTLVLNRNWQPVNVATVSRALVMLWNESAHVVDPNDYRTYT